MSSNFFRGTTADQDSRFGNTDAKLLKKMKFSKVLERPVDMKKVNVQVISNWISERITSLLSFEDDILIDTIKNFLTTGGTVDPKHLQLQLQGFLAKQTGPFVEELWSLLVDAAASPDGIPSVFMERKKQELLLLQAAEAQRQNAIRVQMLMHQQAQQDAKEAADAAAKDRADRREERRGKGDRATRWGAAPEGEGGAVGGDDGEAQGAPGGADRKRKSRSGSGSRSPRRNRRRSPSRSASRDRDRRERPRNDGGGRDRDRDRDRRGGSSRDRGGAGQGYGPPDRGDSRNRGVARRRRSPSRSPSYNRSPLRRDRNQSRGDEQLAYRRERSPSRSPVPPRRRDRHYQEKEVDLISWQRERERDDEVRRVAEEDREAHRHAAQRRAPSPSPSPSPRDRRARSPERPRRMFQERPASSRPPRSPSSDRERRPLDGSRTLQDRPASGRPRSPLSRDRDRGNGHMDRHREPEGRESRRSDRSRSRSRGDRNGRGGALVDDRSRDRREPEEEKVRRPGPSMAAAADDEVDPMEVEGFDTLAGVDEGEEGEGGERRPKKHKKDKKEKKDKKHKKHKKHKGDSVTEDRPEGEDEQQEGVQAEAPAGAGDSGEEQPPKQSVENAGMVDQSAMSDDPVSEKNAVVAAEKDTEKNEGDDV